MNKQYYLENKEEIEDSFRWLAENKVICSENHDGWQFVVRMDSLKKDCIYFYDDGEGADSVLYLLELTTDDVSIEELQEKLNKYFKDTEYPEFEEFFSDNNIEFNPCSYNSRADYLYNTICIRESDRKFETVNDVGITDTAIFKGEPIAISGYCTFEEFVDDLAEDTIEKIIELSETVDNDADSIDQDDGYNYFKECENEQDKLLALKELIYSFNIEDFNENIFNIISKYVILQQIEKSLIKKTTA